MFNGKITETRNHHWNERSLSASLLDAERKLAQDEIVGLIAHEIRNRLVAVGGYTRQLRKDSALGREQALKLDIIKEEVERLEAYLEELSCYTSPGQPVCEPVSIFEIIEDSCSHLDRDLKKVGIDIEIECPEQTSEIRVDRMQISQVIFILLRNAIHEPFGSGRILINIRFDYGYCFLKLSDLREHSSGSRLRGWFNPLLPGNPLGKGLGLSLVNQILDNHGGMLFFDDNNPALSILLPLPQYTRS